MDLENMASAYDRCNICEGKTSVFQCAYVLNRYEAKYIRCESCGFLQVENPVWLAEAYGDAITATDIGCVYRADFYADLTKAVMHILLNPSSECIDYGGGYGLFVRKMRDRGYDFRWFDRHCQNIFATGFQAEIVDDKRFGLLTSFEVVEHLQDPMGDIRRMARLSDNLLFSTELLPIPTPPISDWWYYAPEHGQHIAFYTLRSLLILSERLGGHLCSNRSTGLHLISTDRKSDTVFNLITKPRFARVFDFLKQMPGRLSTDFEQVKARARD